MNKRVLCNFREDALYFNDKAEINGVSYVVLSDSKRGKVKFCLWW